MVFFFFNTSASLTLSSGFVGAYVWRSSWFKALKLNSNGRTNFRLVLGIRKLLNPPLPNGYYGNAFVSQTLELIVGN